MMGGDKNAYCEYHKLYGHAMAKCQKLKDWLATKFMTEELEGIQFDFGSGSEQDKKTPKKQDRSDDSSKHLRRN